MAQASGSDTSKWLQVLALAAAAVLLWLFLGMVFLERFIPPLSGLGKWILPWKELAPPEAGLDQFLSFMQKQFDASIRVSQYAFVLTIASFVALTVYLSVVYEQKQRRARENMLLVLKNQEIARRNEFIRYISATIGHEFKNNLGRIKRRIELLDGLTPDTKERIDDNLDKLFADIDIFKKISDEREAGLVEFSMVDLSAMLAGLACQYGDLARIEVPDDPPVPMIYAAPPLLKTVFENIIDNAIKYKKAGQPRAHISISCAIDRDGSRQYVRVSFRDEGTGMDRQQADQCFYKGKGSGEGWGQGLYFAKYVVGLHAGKIRVGKDYTAPDRGAEFIISLPFIEEAADV